MSRCRRCVTGVSGVSQLWVVCPCVDGVSKCRWCVTGAVGGMRQTGGTRYKGGVVNPAGRHAMRVHMARLLPKQRHVLQSALKVSPAAYSTPAYTQPFTSAGGVLYKGAAHANDHATYSVRMSMLCSSPCDRGLLRAQRP